MPQQTQKVMQQWPLHALDGGYENVPFKVFTQRDLDKIVPLQALPEAMRFEMKVVSSVLPFRVNQYVIDELIDWNNIPADPIFQLTFPQRGMLAPAHYDRIAALLRDGADKATLNAAIAEVRLALNPHPADHDCRCKWRCFPHPDRSQRRRRHGRV